MLYTVPPEWSIIKKGLILYLKYGFSGYTYTRNESTNINMINMIIHLKIDLMTSLAFFNLRWSHCACRQDVRNYYGKLLWGITMDTIRKASSVLSQQAHCQACGWLAPFRSGLDWRWLMFQVFSSASSLLFDANISVGHSKKETAWLK